MSENPQTPSGPPTLPDPRPLLWRAVDQTERQVAAVTPADLDRPTPCADWTVRDLVGHLVGVERRIGHIMGGGHPDEMPAHTTGVADTDWWSAWSAARTGLTTALADDAVLDGMVTHPAGVMPAPRALFIYISELTVHSWDLARALGRDGDGDLDPELAQGSYAAISQALPAEPRGGPVPFGPVVAVPADAEPYAQLVGWLGRDPGWTA